MLKIKPEQITLYEFSELSPQAQINAIADHVAFMTQNASDFYDENNKGCFEEAIDRAIEDKAWFVEQYVYEYCKDFIVKGFEHGKCHFDVDGEMLFFIKDGKAKLQVILDLEIELDKIKGL